MVAALGNIDNEDTKSLSNQVFGTALTVLHEYGHYGDKKTNNGYNTGQYNGLNNGFNFNKDSESKDYGSQKYKVTTTGHRGTDIEYHGFNTSISWNSTTDKFSFSTPRVYVGNRVSPSTKAIVKSIRSNILKMLKIK